MRDFYLLTKDNCPLCVQAIQLIHHQALEEPIRLHMVDIAQDPELLQEYGVLVPVLVRGQDDQELKWPFQEKQLREFLEDVNPD